MLVTHQGSLLHVASSFYCYIRFNIFTAKRIFQKTLEAAKLIKGVQ